MRRVKPAFSLAETVVVLAIFLLLVQGGSLQVKRTWEKILFDQTCTAVLQTLQHEIRVAALKQQTVVVHVNNSRHELRVTHDGQTAEKIRLPEGMTVDSPVLEGLGSQIRSGGCISPYSISFKGYGYAKRYTIQLMWGKVREKD